MNFSLEARLQSFPLGLLSKSIMPIAIALSIVAGLIAGMSYLNAISLMRKCSIVSFAQYTVLIRFNPMSSQAITKIRVNTSLPINAGMKFPRMKETHTTGIFGLLLGVTAIVPVFLVLFI